MQVRDPRSEHVDVDLLGAGRVAERRRAPPEDIAQRRRLLAVERGDRGDVPAWLQVGEAEHLRGQAHREPPSLVAPHLGPVQLGVAVGAAAGRAVGIADHRSAFRRTNWTPWNTSVMDADLLSTRPVARPARWTRSKSTSVSVRAARLGHAIHNRPAGAIARASGSIRFRRVAARVTKATITSRSRPVRARNETPAGSGASAVSSWSSASGASSTRTREPSAMPSFLHSGVEE